MICMGEGLFQGEEWCSVRVLKIRSMRRTVACVCVCVEDMMCFWFLKMLDFVSKRWMKGVEVCEEVAEGG